LLLGYTSAGDLPRPLRTPLPLFLALGFGLDDYPACDGINKAYRGITSTNLLKKRILIPMAPNIYGVRKYIS
jgi:hypothetical protein